MSWWGILKVDPYLEQGSLNYQKDLFGQGAKGTQTSFKQPSSPTGQIQLPQPNQPEQQLIPKEGQQNLQNKIIPQSQTQTTTQPLSIESQPQLPTTQQQIQFPKEEQPYQIQGNQQPVQTQVADAGGGEDDSDVGDVRANIAQIKQNLTQLPRGPKAKQLTQILTLLSQAAIDPVKQRETALQAKKILQQTFPMNA